MAIRPSRDIRAVQADEDDMESIGIKKERKERHERDSARYEERHH